MVMEHLRVRDMTADDVDAVAVIRTRGWQAAYAGLMPQAYLDGLDPAEDAEQRRALFAAAPPEVVDLVAERDGGLVGWAAFGPARGQDGGPRRPPGGELYALYLSPERIGTGIGHALMDACLLRAAQQGFPSLCLWVLKGNVRARRFYERAGFLADGAEDAYEVDGTPVTEVRYRRPLTRLPG
ncbi:MULTISPECIES: GNAT family N-acetyltransferase [Streptomyces]|uniref:GNAT family N-acetyltransferase n=1 Tax=Streptomyces TaxID=1883 RepID=UPI000519D752|nr:MULTISPECIES: GNAT family N-acetyltransferase [Streptomyces]KOT66295.1 acetyltransferase [Streptomyces rimosus subsp. rimosus]